jgi:hypothetical protein
LSQFETGWVFSLSDGLLKEIAIKRWKEFPVNAWGIGSSLGRPYTVGKNLFMTAEEAKVVAEAARVKKLASLRKQIAKLEAMKFELVSDLPETLPEAQPEAQAPAQRA